MDWIKRNLYFFIGSILAVLLMGLAGFYLYSKWQFNNEMLEKLNASYAELQSLNQEKPHPGSGKVDNIQAAKEQKQQLAEFIDKARRHFERIPALPDSTNVTSQEFAAALGRTVAELQRAATNASVTLPSDFGFSFTAQRPRVTFALGTLQPLSVQLGEVKVISDILFEAKINSLDNIRRERISPDDTAGPQTEYLLKKSVTNDLAVLTPYEITFRCFSTELAAVLAGFASSPYGLMIKSLNVEPAPSATTESPFGITSYGEAPYQMPVRPVYTPAQRYNLPSAEQPEAGAAAAFARRYGLGGAEGPAGGPGAGGVGIPYRGFGGTPATPTYPTYPRYQTYAQPSTAAKGGLPTVLDEKQLKVTMNVDVVKLLPPK